MHDPVDPVKEAQKRGIKVLEFDGGGVLNGMIAKVDGETFISVEKELRQDKKNVVTFHELGHHITDTIFNPGFPRAEHMANKAGREIAIDEESLREIIKDHQDFSILASIFGVTPKMIQARCRDLGLTLLLIGLVTVCYIFNERLDTEVTRVILAMN